MIACFINKKQQPVNKISLQLTTVKPGYVVLGNLQLLMWLGCVKFVASQRQNWAVKVPY